MAFEDNVFVNCPFDADYKPLLKPLLFTIRYLGLQPRIALARSESGESRISKIFELIEGSKYAIHDLSRLKANKKGEISRLNMPFELGVDWGCRRFGRGRLSEKKIVILEASRYTYQAALSDIAGSDIAAHRNEPEEVVSVVRNWLANQCRFSAQGGAKFGGRSLSAWHNSMTTSAIVALVPMTSRICPCPNYWRTSTSGCPWIHKKTPDESGVFDCVPADAQSG